MFPWPAFLAHFAERASNVPEGNAMPSARRAAKGRSLRAMEMSTEARVWAVRCHLKSYLMLTQLFKHVGQAQQNSPWTPGSQRFCAGGSLHCTDPSLCGLKETSARMRPASYPLCWQGLFFPGSVQEGIWRTSVWGFIEHICFIFPIISAFTLLSSCFIGFSCCFVSLASCVEHTRFSLFLCFVLS